MATWEEMVNGTLDPNTGQYNPYNPVTAVSERHKALMEQRQAENIARMQAANPGYLPGGNMQGSGQGFQQFAPPSVMANKDAWLESSMNMANENMSPTDPVAQAQAATGGLSTQGGMGGGQIGSPEQAFGGVPFGDMPDALTSAISNAQGLTPGLAAGMSFMFPSLSQVFAANTMSQDTMEALGELSGMLEGGTIPDANALPESLLNFSDEIDPSTLQGVGIDFGGGGGSAVPGGGTNAPGVGNPTGSGATGQVGIQGGNDDDDGGGGGGDGGSNDGGAGAAGTGGTGGGSGVGGSAAGGL